MPKIQATLEGTKAFIPIDADWYKAKVNGIPDVEQREGKAGSIVLNWELYGNEEKNGHSANNGKKINFDRVIYSGVDERTGKPYSLNKLLSYIGVLEVPWRCGAEVRGSLQGGCGVENTLPPVLQKGSPDYRCPTCNEVPSLTEFMTEDFQNKTALVDVGLEDQMTKSADGKLIKVVDGDGVPQKRNTIKRIKKEE